MMAVKCKSLGDKDQALMKKDFTAGASQGGCSENYT